LSSSSTNFIATQVLNKTSGPLRVTCYTSVNVAGNMKVANVNLCVWLIGSVEAYSWSIEHLRCW